MIKNTYILSSLVAVFSLVLISCSDNTYIPPTPSDARTLTVSVTDAPLDGVSKVMVQFSGVEIKHVDAEAELIEFDAPVDVDILGLQGTLRTSILFEQKVSSGTYEFIRLIINAEQGEFDSLVLLDDNTWQSLYIPDADRIGLKIIQPFFIYSGGNTHLTIDFDLRKSMEKDIAEGDYQLIPSLRVVSDDEAGHISGLVANTLLSENACIGTNNQTNAAVYLFAEFTEGVGPQDIQRNELDPVSSAGIVFDSDTGEYSYTLGYLPKDVPFSAVLVCDASIDAPGTVDTLDYIGEIKTVTVIEELNVDLNF